MSPRTLAPGRLVGLGYDAGADGFDDRLASNPITVRRFGIIDASQRAIAAGRRVALEIGCGTGRLLATLDARVRIGVDVSRGLLAHAVRRDLPVALADAHSMPFSDAVFDAVTAGNAVFRYLDYPRAFRECARVLVPGGRLAVHQYAAWTFSPRRPLRPVQPDNPLHVSDLDEVRSPARDAGFVEERVHLWRTLSFPPYLVRIPVRLARLRLWSHVVFIFRKP